MEVSANVRRTEPTPRREQDGETYSAATRSRSTSTQPIAAPSTATHTSCSRIARATRSAAPRVAHLSACSLDIAGTASARIARRRMLASASSSAASARRICIKSLPRSLTLTLTGRGERMRASGPVERAVSQPTVTGCSGHIAIASDKSQPLIESVGRLPRGPGGELNSTSAQPNCTTDCLLAQGFAHTTRSEEHTSELQSPCNLVCRLLLEKKKDTAPIHATRQTTA